MHVHENCFKKTMKKEETTFKGYVGQILSAYPEEAGESDRTKKMSIKETTNKQILPYYPLSKIPPLKLKLPQENI